MVVFDIFLYLSFGTKSSNLTDEFDKGKICRVADRSFCSNLLCSGRDDGGTVFRIKSLGMYAEKHDFFRVFSSPNNSDFSFFQHKKVLFHNRIISQ